MDAIESNCNQPQFLFQSILYAAAYFEGLCFYCRTLERFNLLIKHFNNVYKKPLSIKNKDSIISQLKSVLNQYHQKTNKFWESTKLVIFKLRIYILKLMRIYTKILVDLNEIKQFRNILDKLQISLMSTLQQFLIVGIVQNKIKLMSYLREGIQ